ncbi:MAG TPA: anti-sigma factor [Solirubrobacteraceae bacterium]|nr:anti-sigma factor [Solirubrobacteraceae bacterium]
MSEHELHGSHQDCDGNAAPYVLGALSESEHHAFLAHLQTCAVCREEVAALQVVADALPLAAPQLLAPPALKDRVMAQVAAEPRALDPELQPAAEREAVLRAGAEPAAGAGAAATAEPAAPTRATRGRFAWRPMFAPVGLAAAALIAVLVIVLAGSGGGSRTRLVRAQVVPRGASGLVSVTGDHAQLTLTHMPATERGRVYELWIKREGAPAPTDALFTVSRTGAATVGVPGSVKGVRALLVTSEPLGGSPAPTRQPAIVATL